MITTIRPPATWACPGSRTVQRYDAPRDEWLTARRLGVGGSDFATLLGLTPHRWGTVYGLWLDKIGRGPVDRASAQMDKGRDLEPLILAKFSNATGLQVRHAGLQRSRHCDRMQFSPDAFSEDGRLVEAKMITRYGQDKWSEGVPLMYEWQIRYGLAVTGKTRAYLAALDDESWQVEVHEISARPGDLDFCRQQVTAFWNYVETRTPPPVDPTRVSPQELLARHPAVLGPAQVTEALILEQALADVARYAEISALERQARAAKPEKDRIAARLQLQIGDKEYLCVQGTPIARWKQIGRSHFRERDFKSEHPDLAAQYTDTTPTRRLELVTTPKEHTA